MKNTTDNFAESQVGAEILSLEHYFTHNINRAAVFLHPRMKWRWLEKYWETKPTWI
jgi:hypothetical protein